jgi:hypothetical protein
MTGGSPFAAVQTEVSDVICVISPSLGLGRIERDIGEADRHSHKVGPKYAAAGTDGACMEPRYDPISI